MQAKYNDPYELPREIIVPDGNPDALKEIQDFLNENARLIQNAERRERYHTPYHLEALDYDEGLDYVSCSDPERTLLQKEQHEVIRAALAKLTNTQYRRVYLYFYEEMTFRKIAKAERTSVNAVHESIASALLRLKKELAEYFSEFF